MNIRAVSKLVAKLAAMDADNGSVIRQFSNTSAVVQLDDRKLAPVGTTRRRMQRSIQEQHGFATEEMLEMVNAPAPDEWTRTVRALAEMGVVAPWGSIGTARWVRDALYSYFANMQAASLRKNAESYERQAKTHLDTLACYGIGEV